MGRPLFLKHIYEKVSYNIGSCFSYGFMWQQYFHKEEGHDPA